MEALLDALCEWRRTAINGVTFVHVLDRQSYGTPPALPYSLLSGQPDKSDVRAMVPVTITEVLRVGALLDAQSLSIYDVLDVLRKLSGKASYIYGARIHSHQLQRELIGIDRTGHAVATLTWALKASWDLPAPRAAFTYAAGQFTDASSSTPTAWAWDFGDSTTSTAQNPTHTLAAPSTVTLVTRNRFGKSTHAQLVTP